MATTTYSDGPIKIRKPFAWSFSRLRNFETCPKKSLNVDILKTFPMDASPALEEGQRVHDAIAKFLKDRTPLPGDMRDYYPEIRRVIGNDPPGIQWIIEEMLALRRDLVPMNPDDYTGAVWVRAKIDFAKVGLRKALIVDWKSGKIIEDLPQLGVMAACLFAKFPRLDEIRTAYIWLGQNARTVHDYKRTDMPAFWLQVAPRIEAYENAWRTGEFPPKPSGLCVKHCQVQSCQYWGKGTRG